MALADYFHRSAIAASQVLAGYDGDALAERLERTTVEVSLEEANSDEARALMDLTIRLLARFYPRLCVSGAANDLARYVELARTINPNIEIAGGTGDFGIGIGLGASPGCAAPVFAGSNG